MEGNLARGKPVIQSSTGWNGPAAKAVDGVRNPNYDEGSCSHTLKDQRPWWRVDLQSYQRVKKVTLTTRGGKNWGRLRNVAIIVGNDDSPYYDSSTQDGNGL